MLSRSSADRTGQCAARTAHPPRCGVSDHPSRAQMRRRCLAESTARRGTRVVAAIVMQPRFASFDAHEARNANHLVVVPPPALTMRASQLSYVRGAVASPVCVAVTVFLGCVGLGYGGVLGAVIAMITVLALGATTARYKVVRR